METGAKLFVAHKTLFMFSVQLLYKAGKGTAVVDLN